MVEITPYINTIALLSFLTLPLQNYYTLVGRFCLGEILRWVQHASKRLLEATAKGLPRSQRYSLHIICISVEQLLSIDYLSGILLSFQIILTVLHVGA